VIEGVAIAAVAALAGFLLGRARRRVVEVVPDGFIHVDHVRDPEHYDERGVYRWWGE
jgi:hypothetical protein